MIGIDIVEVARIERLREVYGDKFLNKVFTGRELDYVMGKKRSAESLAGRFAAKEAFMKAWGRRLPWKGIEVRPGERGNPYILFEGERFDEVSISHERSYAVSVVRIALRACNG
jgi:holo-[acyl-carrier-protein] synthase